MRRRVDPDRLLEDAVGGVAGYVQREQPRRLDVAVMAQPDQEGGEQQVEDQLIQERRLEVPVGRVSRRPEVKRDLQPPGQAGRLAEQLLVEVVADPADRLGHQQGGRHRVHEQRHARPGPAHPPGSHQGGDGDGAPDAQPAAPHGEHAVPDVRDVHGRGDVEVDPPADDPGRDRPERHVPDQVRVAAHGPPAAPRDHDRRRDADQVHQRVEVNLERADVETADRRAGNVHGASLVGAGGDN